MSHHTQKASFLAGEADAYFARNPFDANASRRDLWNLRLSQLVRSGDRVLEIGCSDGRRVATIGELSGVDCELVGVDPSTEAIESGRTRFPSVDLRVGTADATGVDGEVRLLLFGFCLYLCDRSSLFAITVEADRLLADGGVLAVIDFDPPAPLRRQYRHLDGIWSYKMDYAGLFLASPAYTLIEKHRRGSEGPVSGWIDEPPGDRVALTILRKCVDEGYSLDA
jgi:ubiquinone/menaquinone biosynthesis C-methylase UbiE